MTRTKETGRHMEQKALTPLAKDAYSYGAEQGFRLGWLAAGKVVAAALGERHWRIRDQLRGTLRRRFDEELAQCTAGAPGEGPGNF